MINGGVDKVHNFWVHSIDLVLFKGAVWIGDLLDKILVVWIWHAGNTFDDFLA